MHNPSENGQHTSRKEKLQAMDLSDNQHDLERMQPEEVTLDLPDVSDIPGQEHIHPPRMNSFADTTISSADEEGTSIFGKEDDDFNVSDEELALLDKAGDSGNEADRMLTDKLSLDELDNEGDPLQEASLRQDITGNDMDMVAATDNEGLGMGEEDEDIGRSGNHEKNGSINPILPITHENDKLR